MSVRKQFSQSLYDETNAICVATALHDLHSSGINAIENPDRYGPDIIAYSGFRPSSYVEVEMKRVWRADQREFPWTTIQLPHRKTKFLELGIPIEFWIFRSDMQMVVIIPEDAVRSSIPIEVSNSMISAGELFHQIPIDQCIVRGVNNE